MNIKLLLGNVTQQELYIQRVKRSSIDPDHAQIYAVQSRHWKSMNISEFHNALTDYKSPLISIFSQLYDAGKFQMSLQIIESSALISLH